MEKFYIIVKLGSSDGFQVIDLESKTAAQGSDALFFEKFHKDGPKELFEIRRVNFKTYYTYIRYGLSKIVSNPLTGKPEGREGCMLGLSYVYEDKGNVKQDFLGLRKRMKEALQHLLEKNGEIKIASFNDKKVIESLNHIEKFTKGVNASTLSLPLNPVQYSTQNPNDLTNEMIWKMLEKSVSVEISEEIPTKLQIKDTEIKNLSLQNQTKQTLINTQGKDIENLRRENADRDTTIDKLNKELEDTKKGNGKRDAKISSLLSEIKGLLSNDKQISGGQSRREPVKSKPDNRLNYINIGLSMLIVIILLLFNTCKGGGSETEEVQTLNEDITELNTQKETLEKEKKELESQVEDLQKEVNEKDKKIIDLEEKNEKLKKEKKEQNKPKQDKKNTAKAKANKTEDNAEKSSGEQKK